MKFLFFCVLMFLTACGMPMYNGPYPSGYGPKYSCVESSYAYRDVASKASAIITSSGNYKIAALGSLIGFILDYSNYQNHGCEKISPKPKATPDPYYDDFMQSNQKNRY